MPIITCCNKEFNIAYDNDDTSSEYIKDVITSFGNVDVVIPVPDKYCTVIDNYVEFTRGNKIPITSRERLFLCFQLNTLFIDDIYFKYLSQQTFNNWSYMCTMVYNDFNNDLQWSFFVHAPYDFIPKHLLNTNLFMSQWNKINQNVIIKVNHNSEVYYNNVITGTENGHNQKSINTYHTVNDKKIGYERKILYNDDNNNMNDISYDSGKLEGPERHLYNDDQNMLQTEEYYVNDKRHGPYRIWRNNEQHTLMYEEYYIDGKRHGPYRVWFDNDQHTLSREDYYINGKLDGPSRSWYNNVHHTLKTETHFVKDERDGEWREWFDNDHHTEGGLRHTLKTEGHYVKDKQDGEWRSWFDNVLHTLESEGRYTNGKLDGKWREWFDNDLHTLKYEGHYTNGDRNGHWIQYNENGDINFDGYYVDGEYQQIN